MKIVSTAELQLSGRQAGSKEKSLKEHFIARRAIFPGEFAGDRQEHASVAACFLLLRETYVHRRFLKRREVRYVQAAVVQGVFSSWGNPMVQLFLKELPSTLSKLERERKKDSIVRAALIALFELPVAATACRYDPK